MSRELTNKLLILNSILLGIILSMLLILNFDGLVKRFSHSKAETPKKEIEWYGPERHYPVQDSLKSFFEGLKNDTIKLPDQITEIITTKLNGFNWNNEFQDEDVSHMYHETIFAQEFPPDQGPLRKWIVLTFSNFARNHYQLAWGKVSLFEFQKEDEYWRMTQNFIAFGHGDQNGFVPLGCELVRIGRNNKYAVIIHTSYSGRRGQETETKTVYMEVDGAFESVFDFTSYENYNDYPPCYSYREGYTEMRIIESDKARFDIVTKSEEADWEDITFGVVKHFVFTGAIYEENPCWLYTDTPIHSGGK